MRGPMGIGSDRYILDEEGNPVVEPDLMKWAKWIEHNERTIAHNELRNIRVSTIFLGIDHSFGVSAQKYPLIFETMVFDDNKQKSNYDQFQDRYSTRKEALRGHNKILKKLFNPEEITLSNLKK